MVGLGYPLAELWKMTPRQLAGIWHFASRRQRRDQLAALSVAAQGARGDAAAIKKQLKELDKP